MRGAREGKVIAMEGRPLTLQLAQNKVEVTRVAFVMNTILKIMIYSSKSKQESKQVLEQTNKVSSGVIEPEC